MTTSVAERGSKEYTLSHRQTHTHTIKRLSRIRRRHPKTDDYRRIYDNLVERSAILACERPQSQPASARACLPSPAHAHLNSHYYTIALLSPAHSRSLHITSTTNCCSSLSHSIFFSSSLDNSHQPPTRSPPPTTPANTMYLLTSTSPQESSCTRLPTV